MIRAGALGCPGRCACGGGRALGEVCPPCYFAVGAGCVACPDGSSIPECVGCRGGVPAASTAPWYERPVAGPIIVGLVSAITLGIAIPIVRRQLGKVGVALE